MIHTATARRGMVTAPHHLATEAGSAILREGGNAIEAMIAMAASIAVVYPHMNSIGGDGFWLITLPGREPVAIRACGATGANVVPALYGAMDAIPPRGPLAANTVAGAVSGWYAAEAMAQRIGGKLSRDRLLEDAIWYARNGIAVSAGQTRLTESKRGELEDVYGFSTAFMPGGAVPQVGSTFVQERLGNTLAHLAQHGFDDYYRGSLAQQIGADLARAGVPVTGEDLAAHHAVEVTPLGLSLGQATIWNHPPPTQGLASLMILGIFDRLDLPEAESTAYVHALVEATKQAFLTRDSFITDPDRLIGDPNSFLSEAELNDCAARVDPECALPWPSHESRGDTIWMGAIDSAGVSASYIQSIYWEFGSGVVLDESGIQWQNRGSSFSLDPSALNALEPGRLPFHTLNPACAIFNDGRHMVYGTMGGEGQPQTQSAVFSRYAHYGMGLQAAVSAPRWLLGRTWGEQSTTLKLESRFDTATIQSLGDLGHNVEILGEFDDAMGHAGAVVRHADGLFEGASDPRSDGRAGGW